MTLKIYEREVLKRLFDKEIISWNYVPIERARSLIKWGEIRKKYRIKKNFKSVVRKLKGFGYVSDHGKSLHVVSLTKHGVELVEAENK